jgi:hypothetical protein
MRCMSSSRNWPIQFALAALPLLVRLVQSVKRYSDSKLYTHLINVSLPLSSTPLIGGSPYAFSLQGGKYGAGIISYVLYFHWRHQGILFSFRFTVHGLFV